MRKRCVFKGPKKRKPCRDMGSDKIGLVRRLSETLYGKIKKAPVMQIAGEHPRNEESEGKLGGQGTNEGSEDEVLIPE